MPRWKSQWNVVPVIAAVVILIAGCSGHGPGKGHGDKQPPVPVTVVPVKQEKVPIYLTATGTVQALKTVTVQPQVGGRLLSIDFKGGQKVTKGQVLAEIDPRTYQADYDQAVARMHSDEALLATARSNLARSKKLIKKHYISQKELDTQANKVKQLEATVAADKANAEAARVNLHYTKIRAPITGQTGIRQVDPGNVLTTSSAIVVLTHVHPINVMFSLPAGDLDRVRAANARGPVPVTAIQRSGDQHVLASNGVLKVINNRIDPNTGTFTLKSQFPNQHNHLWPGQYVRVRLKVSTVQNGLVIPTQAVQRGPDGEYVYLLQKDNTVKMQPVTVADHVGDTHELISKGLAAGDKVVTEGQFRLKPGSKVKPFKPGQVPVPKAAKNAKAGKTGKGKAGKDKAGKDKAGKGKTKSGKDTASSGT